MSLSEADLAIQAVSPALWEALSPLGRRLRQSANFLPQQTAEARGKPFNATIGQITDGHGKAVSLPAMADALGMSEAERSQAFLYSPVEGLAELRRAWRARQRGDRPESLPSSLPVVTLGAEQGWAIAAEMFAGEGRAVILSEPVPPGLRDLCELKLGAASRRAGLASDGLDRALDGLPDAEPALVFLNGTLEKAAGREALRRSLARAAAYRPLVAVVESEIFWSLLGVEENLIPLRVESVPELGVGFLTFPFPPESAVALALESKVKMLLRAVAGSPSACSQTVLLHALRWKSG